jgi:hypothetical protein
MAIFQAISLGATLLGGLSQRRAATERPLLRSQAAEFNAGLIERDIGLLERQREIINRNFLIEGQRSRAQCLSATCKAVFGLALATPALTCRKARRLRSARKRARV